MLRITDKAAMYKARTHVGAYRESAPDGRGIPAAGRCHGTRANRPTREVKHLPSPSPNSGKSAARMAALMYAHALNTLVKGRPTGSELLCSAF